MPETDAMPIDFENSAHNDALVERFAADFDFDTMLDAFLIGAE